MKHILFVDTGDGYRCSSNIKMIDLMAILASHMSKSEEFAQAVKMATVFSGR